jgi:predicted GIY-YIG superfamily endonuclease
MSTIGMSANNIFYIYILECANDKYYIGKTNNPLSRLEQHINKEGSVWTINYKPIKIIETIETSEPLDEDKITKKYMMKYGIDNVRGGSYTKLKLDDWMIKSLEHEFQDICYDCNKKGHFTKDCPYNIKKYLESFTDIMKINKEIRQLESVYEKIIILNTQITQCDSIEKLIVLNSTNPSSNINKTVNNWYRENFNHHNDMYFNTGINIDIKIYQLKIFHLERKKELKDIFDIHISEELVKMKLIELFEMKINILNST